MSIFARLAADRVQYIINAQDDCRAADVIADVIHYCTVNNISFQDELQVAYGYVAEEEGIDEELA